MTDDRSACADDCTHPHHRDPGPPPRRTNGTLKRQQSEAAKVNTAHPICLACDGAVPPHSGETFSKWMRRRFCSTFCRQSYTNRGRIAEAAAASVVMEAAHPPCTICGRAVRRRKKENPTKYQARATCGEEVCFRAHHKAMAKARADAEAAERAIDRELRKAAEEAEDARTRGEVDYGAGFGAHNIRTAAFGRLGASPLMSSFGVSANWAVRQ